MAFDPLASASANAVVWSLVLYAVVAAQDADDVALDALEDRVAAIEGAIVSPPPPVPVPIFTIPPSIAGTPTVGQTLTGMTGTIINGTVVSRRWLLGAAVASTAQTYLATATGALVYEVTATGPGGTTVATSAAVTVTAAAASLGKLSTSVPLHKGAATSATLQGATSGSAISAYPGVTQTGTGATRALSGTPTARSALLTETLGGVSRDTLLFAPETAARTMKLGMGVAGLAPDSPNNVWLDCFKAAVVLTAPATADSNGMPLTLGLDGNGALGCAYIVPVDDGTVTPVQYRILTDGDVDIQGWTKSGNDYLKTHTGPAGSMIVHFTAIRATKPTYMNMVRQDELARFQSGKITKAGFAAKLAGFRHIRFMNWAMVNRAEKSPTPANYITYAEDYGGTVRSVPFSVQVAVCFELGIGGWFNLHHKVTDAEFQAMWPLLDAMVAAGLPVIVEVSNEIWNGQFPQWTYARDQGLLLGATGGEYLASPWWNGYRSGQLAKLSRGMGYDWALGCMPVLQDYQAVEVFKGIAAAGALKSDFSTWITTNYSSGSLNFPPADLPAGQDAKQQAWVASNNYHAAFDNVLNYTGFAQAASVAILAARLAEAVAIADANGWKCKTYEGNILHLNRLPHLGDRPAYGPFFHAMAYHPLAKPAMNVNLEVTQAAGVDCATLFDTDSGAPLSNPSSDFGVFGLFGRPAFGALTDWMAAGGAASPIVAPTPTPTISFSIATIAAAEGNTGTSTVGNTINMVRRGVTGAQVVNLTYGGTATAGSDYVAGPASVTVPSGASSVSFNMTINGDALIEASETIIINAVVAGYSSATASKTITIENDDVPTSGYRHVLIEPTQSGGGHVPGGAFYRVGSSEFKLEDGNGPITHGPTEWGAELITNAEDGNAVARVVDNSIANSWITPGGDVGNAAKKGEVIVDVGKTNSANRIAPTKVRIGTCIESDELRIARAKVYVSNNKTTWTLVGQQTGSDLSYSGGFATINLTLSS